ncbi:MAG: hypothetical protein ABW219_16300 [Ilumatobacteraceae bacterium]
MPDLPDLDTRIRDLVTRAVADAPAPPEIGAPAMPTVDPPPDRRRWWIGGTAAVLAAAAAVVTFALVVDDDQGAITPASVPTTVAPEPTSTPASTPPATSVPDTGPPITPGPTTTVATPTPAGLLTAGPEGVRERVGDTVRTVTAEPVVMALDAGDGRVIVQRRQGDISGGPELWTDADTVPLVVGDDGGLTPLLPELDWGGGVTLHDVEVVDGRRLLLYSVVVGPITFDSGQEDLWSVDLATGERTSIAPAIGGWEYGTGRLHLATTGLVVGAASGGPTTAATLFTVPGSAAAAAGDPDPTALRLPSADCVDCSHAFTVSADGSQIAWVTPDDEIYGVTIAEGRAVDEPHRLGPAPSRPVGDLELTSNGVIVSFAAGYQEIAEPPVVVTWDGAETTLEGTVATTSPGMPATAPVPTGPTTTTASTTTSLLPLEPAGVMMATAGPDGVAVLEGGVEVRRIDQPAEIALLTPGGAVLFQTARPSPDGTPGDPQIWRPDGTVAPFLGPLPAGQSYRLHDVAQIEGVPTVLYGVRTTGVAPEDHTEVVRALRLDPAGWVTDDITEFSTWEGGVSRLSLSDQGLIIGTAGESVTSSFFGAVVPRTPAAGQGDPMTRPEGVEASYGDCSECPSDFTISADGTSIVWTEGTELVVLDVASGERRTWTVPSLANETLTVLDVRTSSDGGVEVAITFGFPGETDAPNAVVAATSPPGGVVETDTGARSATFGP